MQVLKHPKTKRLFLATKALLRHKQLVPASAEEAKTFLGSMSATQKTAVAAQKNTVHALIPDDFDLDINITSFGKAELMALAAKLGVVGIGHLKIKAMKGYMAEILTEAREKQAEAETNETADE